MPVSDRTPPLPDGAAPAPAGPARLAARPAADDMPEQPVFTVDGNRLTLLDTGPRRLRALIDLIDGARHSLRILYYIYADDDTGRRINAALAAAARRGVLGRAAVIAGIGLLLGLWPSGIAVILVNYGLLFAVAALFLGLRARVLVPLALGWVLLAPVASHALRPLVAEPTLEVTSLLTLRDPVAALTEVLLTGYYPVLVQKRGVRSYLIVLRFTTHRVTLSRVK